tara:strand:+ start:823 stop:2895 length:2073 start_codon:yes stop_codon:yes gene_type:complete
MAQIPRYQSKEFAGYRNRFAGRPQAQYSPTGFKVPDIKPKTVLERQLQGASDTAMKLATDALIGLRKKQDNKDLLNATNEIELDAIKFQSELENMDKGDMGSYTERLLKATQAFETEQRYKIEQLKLEGPNADNIRQIIEERYSGVNQTIVENAIKLGQRRDDDELVLEVEQKLNLALGMADAGDIERAKDFFTDAWAMAGDNPRAIPDSERFKMFLPYIQKAQAQAEFSKFLQGREDLPPVKSIAEDQTTTSREEEKFLEEQGEEPNRKDLITGTGVGRQEAEFLAEQLPIIRANKVEAEAKTSLLVNNIGKTAEFYVDRLEDFKQVVDFLSVGEGGEIVTDLGWTGGIQGDSENKAEELEKRRSALTDLQAIAKAYNMSPQDVVESLIAYQTNPENKPPAKVEDVEVLILTDDPTKAEGVKKTGELVEVDMGRYPESKLPGGSRPTAQGSQEQKYPDGLPGSGRPTAKAVAKITTDSPDVVEGSLASGWEDLYWLDEREAKQETFIKSVMRDFVLKDKQYNFMKMTPQTPEEDSKNRQEYEESLSKELEAYYGEDWQEIIGGLRKDEIRIDSRISMNFDGHLTGDQLKKFRELKSGGFNGEQEASAYLATLPGAEVDKFKVLYKATPEIKEVEKQISNLLSELSRSEVITSSRLPQLRKQRHDLIMAQLPNSKRKDEYNSYILSGASR